MGSEWEAYVMPQWLNIEDSSGIFWDNDSLAALLALELKVDLLVLLSDVEGLYSGPPGEPHSKIIHTYIKEKHHCGITFGNKSRVGRGGMTAKVKAAVHAAFAGIPVIITSGFATDSITKVLKGERVGTLFHKDASLWAFPKEDSAREMAVSARDCSRRLQSISSEGRRRILLDIADALEANEKLILAENMADVISAQQSGYEQSLISRLSLKPGKISNLANSIRILARMEDPVGHVVSRTELFKWKWPSLEKVGKEAMRSNVVLHKIITGAIPENVGQKLIGLVTSRDEIPDLLKLDDVIDLVIPRGSSKLVSQIKESTKIPVLGHADGICHVYIDKSANMEMAKRIVLDAKADYPAACNAMVVNFPSIGSFRKHFLCISIFFGQRGINDIIAELRIEGVVLYGGAQASSSFDIPQANSFHHEYSSLACTLEVVDDVFSAIEHIHRYGSAHTDCIVTEDKKLQRFSLSRVDSAAVFHNASTFLRMGLVLGLVLRIHARGPVGVEGLLTSRWILRGNGQVVDGDKGVVYTHKILPLD
ncbi:hypothetical protein HPP92_003420 [Vanilla planifolia]|uniref:Aspartate/glutamate/uridylate kinase domain-containing protein n=1 Tax=Vanilla planifolia TaxID=51239 RepID=A0A835VFF9_VANPL|nr:hypothetical protein HPP92_003420 [Vanilla planifolia]